MKKDDIGLSIKMARVVRYPEIRYDMPGVVQLFSQHLQDVLLWTIRRILSLGIRRVEDSHGLV